jgi:hypothetical protein
MNNRNEDWSHENRLSLFGDSIRCAAYFCPHMFQLEKEVWRFLADRCVAFALRKMWHHARANPHFHSAVRQCSIRSFDNCFGSASFDA